MYFPAIRRCAYEGDVLMAAPDIQNHEERAHSPLGASSCSRWWNCPGSIQLSKGFHNRSSIFAREGTAAHELSEMCLRQDRDAHEFLGITIEVEGDKITVTDEMTEAVQMYVDECRMQADAGTARPMIETRITLERLSPPDNMFGTADFMVQQGSTLCVMDLKYGKGVAVEAEGNPQLKYYALGALYALPDDSGIKYIKVGIVQPRAPGQKIKYAEYSVLELLEWSVELIERAKVAVSGEMTVNPGSWCKFCPASGLCPAQADKAIKAAQLAFSVEDMVEKKVVLPEISTFTPQQMSALLHNVNELESFVNAVRSAAQSMLEADENAIPNWALGPTNPTRKWADPVKAANLLSERKLTEDQIWVREVISPAKAEDAISRKLKADGAVKTLKEGKEIAKTMLKPEIVSQSKGVKLIPCEAAAVVEPTQRVDLFS